MNSNFKFFKISYFMLFFGVAAYYPILGKYYKELGFSGTQIGILFSAATFIQCLFSHYGELSVKNWVIVKVLLL